jgi:hypothetical protein
MSQMNPTGLRAFRAAEDLEAYRRVKLNGDGEVEYADAADDDIGTTETAADADTPVTVRLWNVSGTRKVILGGTVAALATVYPAADGKVDDTVAGNPLGKVLDGGVAGAAVELIGVRDAVP